MGNTIKLSKPLMINGEQRQEFAYDADSISVELYCEAEGRKFKAVGNASAVAEVDYAFHLHLGFAAIIAVNPGVAWEDLGRVKGADITAIANIGRNFIMPSAGATSPGETSDELSEPTPEPFAPLSDTSNCSE